MLKIYENLLRPLLFKISPETAHEFGIETLKIGLGSKFAQKLAAEKFAVESFENLARFNFSFQKSARHRRRF